MFPPSLPCPGESPKPARRVPAFPLKPGSSEPAWPVAVLDAGPRRCYETGMLCVHKAGVRFAGPAPAPSAEDSLMFSSSHQEDLLGQHRGWCKVCGCSIASTPFFPKKRASTCHLGRAVTIDELISLQDTSVLPPV